MDLQTGSGRTDLLGRWGLEPEGPLAAQFALPFGADHLGAGLTHEGLVGDLGAREHPAHGVRGGEGVHGPAVEGAALALEQQPAAGAALVLRGPAGLPGPPLLPDAAGPAAERRRGRAQGRDRARFIGDLHLDLHLRTHGRVWQLELLRGRRGGAQRAAERRFRCGQRSVRGVSVVVLVRFRRRSGVLLVPGGLTGHDEGPDELGPVFCLRSGRITSRLGTRSCAASRTLSDPTKRCSEHK